jgi:uncharacterized membrane protein
MSLERLFQRVRKLSPQKATMMVIFIVVITYLTTLTPLVESETPSYRNIFVRDVIALVFIITMSLYGAYIWIANEEFYQILNQRRVIHISKARILFSGIVISSIGALLTIVGIIKMISRILGWRLSE